MQQLDVAFTTMLNSKAKSDALLSQAVNFAAKTPYDLLGVADGIKQLLAYGTAAEDAIETVEMLRRGCPSRWVTWCTYTVR